MDDSAYDAWVEHNPLRLWRKAQRPAWSLMRTAQHLGVSMTIMQLWERGVHVPSEENMARIATLVGSGTSTRWVEWWNRRPMVAGAQT